MENASKALIIAGTILISVMVLSTAVMLIRMFGNFGNETAEKLYANKLQEFNAQFTKHINQKVTAHDIVTLANLAYQNNIELIDDPSIISNPTELENATSANKNNLFVNISVKFESKKIDSEPNPNTYSNDRFDLANKDAKDNFLNNFSIQKQYSEVPNISTVSDNEGILDFGSTPEPLPVYFLCTNCHISENTKRVYYMEFESYYYKSTNSQRKKEDIKTNIIEENN